MKKLLRSAFSVMCAVIMTVTGSFVTHIYAAAGSLQFHATMSTINDVIFDGKQFVEVGQDVIKASKDGVNWSIKLQKNKCEFKSIVFSKGTYVAVGATKALGTSGAIFTSKDGSKWTQRVSGTASVLVSVTYGNGKYVAVGEKGTILISSNGESWKSVKSGITSLFKSVVFNKNLFIASCYGDFMDSYMISSKDGVNWVNAKNPIYKFQDIALANGKFFAYGDEGQCSFSSDGVNWDSSTFPGPDYTVPPLECITYAKGRYVAYSGYSELNKAGAMYTSKDAKTWEKISDINDYFNKIVWNGSKFLAVGKYGLCETSYDGIKWSMLSCGRGIERVFYANGKFFASANGFGPSEFFSSTDGERWNSVCSDSGMDSVGNIVNIIWQSKQKQYAAIGERGVFISKNGTKWTKVVSGIGFSHVTYANGLLVARGGNIYSSGFLVSKDGGTTWKEASSVPSQDPINDIIFCNNQFIAVGDKVILTSKDGMVWKRAKIDKELKYAHVIYVKGKYIAYGMSYGVSTNNYGYSISKDGVSWKTTTTTNSQSPYSELNSITAVKNVFYARRYKTIVYSTDGIKWSDVPQSSEIAGLSSSDNIGRLVCGNNKIIAVGDDGSLYVSSVPKK